MHALALGSCGWRRALITSVSRAGMRQPKSTTPHLCSEQLSTSNSPDRNEAARIFAIPAYRKTCFDALYAMFKDTKMVPCFERCVWKRIARIQVLRSFAHMSACLCSHVALFRHAANHAGKLDLGYVLHVSAAPERVMTPLARVPSGTVTVHNMLQAGKVTPWLPLS